MFNKKGDYNKKERGQDMMFLDYQNVNDLYTRGYVRKTSIKRRKKNNKNKNEHELDCIISFICGVFFMFFIYTLVVGC